MFLHAYQPQPILINLGFIQIHWYGFIITVGIIIGLFILLNLAKKYKIPDYKEYINSILFYGLIGGIIGARIWHVLVEISYYLNYPANILKIWHGGLASHGAILGGLVSSFLFHRHFQKKNNLQIDYKLMLDISVPVLALIHICVRLGNYFNQELYGKPLDSIWAIPISPINRIAGFESFSHFHPTFLYEALFFLLIFVIFIILHKLRIKKAEQTKIRHTQGLFFSFYLIAYGIERFLIEFLRIDESNIVLELRLAQVTSLVLIIVGISFVLYLKKISKKIR